MQHFCRIMAELLIKLIDSIEERMEDKNSWKRKGESKQARKQA